MKKREKPLFVKTLIVIILLIVLASCTTQQYVVVSDIAVMNVRDGRIHHVKKDSTLQIYDKIRLTDSDLQLKLVTKNKP